MSSGGPNVYARSAVPARQVLSLTGSVLRRPDLWLTAARSYRTLVPNSWWRRRPFLPLPNAEWINFRMVTAYGGNGEVSGARNSAVSHDLVLWLEWLRAWNPDHSP